ncbi:MAG: Rieske (2Fe-2S) protein [Bacteroidota bacterium]|nr:Rieske (2Fe-2S) protein [Bacteroidota bacterium]
MNRRDLIRNIAAGTVTLFVVPTAFSSCEKESVDPDGNNPPDDGTLTIDLAREKYSDLGSSGGSVKEGNVIVINTGDGFIALSSICTHQGCSVSYDKDANELPCPCHGSVFSTSGSVLQGPAEAPLKKYEVSQEGDILTIVL